MQRIAGLSFLCVAAAYAIFAFALAERGTVQHQSFKAFYCAGQAVRQARNPYLVEPLRTCERTVAPREPSEEGYVEPAPLPGYVLVVFAALSAFPAHTAAEIYAAVLIFAGIGGALALASVVHAKPVAVLLTVLPLLLLNVAFGEFAPVAVCGICACAYFLSKGLPVAAGIAVCVAMTQPNVGLAAVVAVFVFAPRTRTTIVCCAGAFALASIAALGIGTNADYFHIVLPSQAAAELSASDQYSLSRVLYVMGLPAEACIALAKFSYVAIAAASIAVAGAIARSKKSAELLPLLPPAAVLFGGIYVHDIQMLFAVPAALLIARGARTDWERSLAFVAAALLAVVWTQSPDRAVVVLNALAIIGCAVAVFPGTTVRRVELGMLSAAAALSLLFALQKIEAPVNSASMASSQFTASPGENASAAWLRYLQATPAMNAPRFILKVPTWGGLLLLFFGVSRLVRPVKPIPSGLREPLLANEP